MQEENIYKLISKEILPPEKQPRYKSNFSPTIPPSYSTFALKTTSKPGVSNVGGLLKLDNVSHTNVSKSANFGRLKDLILPSPEHYLRKSGNSPIKIKSQTTTHKSYECQGFKKPPVPTVKEQPILGLKSHKNFIISNAIENILAAPTFKDEEVDWTKKSDFAKIPNYLQKIKEQINEEYEKVREIQKKEEEERNKEKYLVTEDEINKIREGLKTKWNMVNKIYQNHAHITKIDTVGKKRRKENCEREMNLLEKDMAKINKRYIFVDATHS